MGKFLFERTMWSSKFGYTVKQVSIYINFIVAFFLIYYLFNVTVKPKLKAIDTYLGYYSYPLYLSHYMIAILYSGVIGIGVISSSFKMTFTALIPYFVLLIAFSMLIVHLIDIKIDALKRKLKKQKLNK